MHCRAENGGEWHRTGDPMPGGGRGGGLHTGESKLSFIFAQLALNLKILAKSVRCSK
jgi:hypothetical protein